MSMICYTPPVVDDVDLPYNICRKSCYTFKFGSVGKPRPRIRWKIQEEKPTGGEAGRGKGVAILAICKIKK